MCTRRMNQNVAESICNYEKAAVDEDLKLKQNYGPFKNFLMEEEKCFIERLFIFIFQLLKRHAKN